MNILACGGIMSKDFFCGVILSFYFFLFVKFLYVLIIDEKAYRKGYKRGYGTGLIQGKVVYKNLIETEDGLSADCFIKTMTHWPPEK
jgi:hypothetical protein